MRCAPYAIHDAPICFAHPMMYINALYTVCAHMFCAPYDALSVVHALCIIWCLIHWRNILYTICQAPGWTAPASVAWSRSVLHTWLESCPLCGVWCLIYRPSIPRDGDEVLNSNFTPSVYFKMAQNLDLRCVSGLGHWGHSTSRMQSKEVYAPLYLQALSCKSCLWLTHCIL